MRFFLIMVLLVVGSGCQSEAPRQGTSEPTPHAASPEQGREDRQRRAQRSINPLFVVGALQEARVKEARVELEILKNTVEIYRVQHMRSPANLEVLVRERLVEKRPVDPWGEPYQLVWSDAAGVLGSKGPDKQWGNVDDVRIELKK